MDRKTLVLVGVTLLLGFALGTKSARENWQLELPRLAKVAVTPTPSQSSVVSAAEVLPPSVNLGVIWGDIIIKMVRGGAIDKTKFLALYEGRQADLDQVRQMLESSSDQDIVVTQAHSALILNLLWPLGITNKTNVLSQGPIGTQYKGKEGSFASTGGWTVGKVNGGKLFNRYEILTLTQEQEAVVKELAQNIYRPCCG